MSGCFCTHHTTPLGLWSACWIVDVKSSNHLLPQDLTRSAPKELPTQNREGETTYQTYFFCCTETRFHDHLLQSWCWLSIIIFPFLLEGHSWSMLCMRCRATIFFKYLILWQILLHLLPFTLCLPPGILCTSTEDLDAPSGKQSVGGRGTHTYSD